MNTKISYCYRDGDGYNYIESVVLQGVLTYGELLPYLNQEDDTPTFCPDDVGLPHPGRENAKGWPGEADHCWCHFDEEDVGPAEEKDKVTHGKAKDLLAKFSKAFRNDWPAQTFLPK